MTADKKSTKSGNKQKPLNFEPSPKIVKQKPIDIDINK